MPSYIVHNILNTRWTDPYLKETERAKKRQAKSDQKLLAKVHDAELAKMSSAMDRLEEFERREFGTTPKELNSTLVNSRLAALTVDDDGCCYFDEICVPGATSRTLFFFPRLCNNRPGDVTKESYDDLTSFITHIHSTMKYTYHRVFHYSILYLLHGLAHVATEEVLACDQKPSFIPASPWKSGRDTYIAAFLWVASVYHCPERGQQPPTWREFSKISGLSRYQQWQYFEFMSNVMLKPKHRELALNVTKMTRFGFVQELPIKLGDSWWERRGSCKDEKYRRVLNVRERWSSVPLPESEDGRIDDGVLYQLLPIQHREHCRDPKMMGFYGPTLESVRSQVKYRPEKTRSLREMEEQTHLDAIIAFEKEPPAVRWSSVS